MCDWCPWRRVSGFVGGDGDGEWEEEEGKRDQRKSVWSSEPVIRSSGVVDNRVLYRFSDRACAGFFH
jgi:hypothetical protein